MSIKKTLSLLVSCLVISHLSAYSDDQHKASDYFILGGFTNTTIEQNNIQNEITDPLLKFKTVPLMRIIPKQLLKDKIAKGNIELIQSGGEPNYSNGIVAFNESGAVNLGMSNVPVLDQGQYGTCVTFSATAALDARFAIGDYIDQQCSLALDLGLGKNFWNGAYTANDVILPLKQYGFIAKNYCSGQQYPNPNQTININMYNSTSYKGYSDSIITNNTSADLNAVKAALNSGFRVVIGFVYSSAFDAKTVHRDYTVISNNSGVLWACSQPNDTTNRCVTSNSGHEVIITGYDDLQGLLKIRNSWGATAGDSGEYYMTYNFFNIMVFDQTIIQ